MEFPLDLTFAGGAGEKKEENERRAETGTKRDQTPVLVMVSTAVMRHHDHGNS